MEILQPTETRRNVDPMARERSLSLRVTDEDVEQLERLVARLAEPARPGARVTRSSLAVDAMRRGLADIERELDEEDARRG